MKLRDVIFMGVTIIVVVSSGCGDMFHQSWSGQLNKPVSSPPPAVPSDQPIRPRYAEANAPTDNADPATPDPAITQLDARIKQYVGRLPATDLDRKVNPTPVQCTPPPAPAPRAPLAEPAVSQRSVAVVSVPSGATPPVQHSTSANQPVSASPAPTRVETPTTDTAASPQPQQVPPMPATPANNELRVEIVDVRPAAAKPEGRAGAAASGSTANQPIQAPVKTACADTPSLIEQLEEAVRKNPQQLDDQFKLRLLYLATGQSGKATDVFKDVDSVQVEMLSALFKTVASAQDALRDPISAAPAALTAVDELQRVISQQSPIVISKIELITSVNSFGDYEAISPARFPAGRGVHAFCYIEIANFHTEPTPDGRVRTVLSAKIEVFDAAGQVIWQLPVPSIEDRSHTPRRDFFVPLEVKLPANLPAGEYVLKVTIEDKLGATTDQQRKTFTIGQ